MERNIQFLENLLINVCAKANSDFSGVGLVLYSELQYLPVLSMRSGNPYSSRVDLTESLAEISKNENLYHDGFHLLNIEGQLTHISQYFSPPIISGVSIPRNRAIGGRHVAALFGSCIKGVISTGIASSNREISLFSGGHEIHQRGNQ